MYYAIAVVVLLIHVSKSWDRISLLSLSLLHHYNHFVFSLLTSTRILSLASLVIDGETKLRSFPRKQPRDRKLDEFSSLKKTSLYIFSPDQIDLTILFSKVFMTKSMCKLLFLFYKSIMLKLMIFIHEEDFV
jgi:hypothetical protein